MMGRWLSSLIDGHGAEVEGVPRVFLEGPYAPLAEDDLVVPLVEDVLGAVEPLLDGRVHAPLQEDGPLPTCPTSLRSEKFCMFRAPIWSTSAYSLTQKTSRESITSVTMGRPVSAFAFFRIWRPFRPRPWKA